MQFGPLRSVRKQPGGLDRQGWVRPVVRPVPSPGSIPARLGFRAHRVLRFHVRHVARRGRHGDLHHDDQQRPRAFVLGDGSPRHPGHARMRLVEDRGSLIGPGRPDLFSGQPPIPHSLPPVEYGREAWFFQPRELARSAAFRGSGVHAAFGPRPGAAESEEATQTPSTRRMGNPASDQVSARGRLFRHECSRSGIVERPEGHPQSVPRRS